MTDYFQQVVDTVEQMAPISLAEIQRLALLDRLDVKFVLRMHQLAHIITRVQHNYRVLEINGVRPGRYHTTYFDTPDFAMYHAHHNGLRVRHKVRWRWYLDSRLIYLEIKEKTNRERTIKSRITLPTPIDHFRELETSWMPPTITFDPCTLRPVVWNRFRRMTLADFERQERITIDIGLEFGRDDRVTAFPDLAIIEIKQRKFSLSSPMARELHRQQAHPEHISKFCVSMAMFYPDLKQNRFKPLLRRLHAFVEG